MGMKLADDIEQGVGQGDMREDLGDSRVEKQQWNAECYKIQYHSLRNAQQEFLM